MTCSLPRCARRARDGGVIVETRRMPRFFWMEVSRPSGRSGVLAFRAKLGAHMLKVSLAGKRDFEQSVTVAAGRPFASWRHLPTRW